VARTFSRIRLVVGGVIVIALALLLARLADCGAGLGIGTRGQTAPPATEAKPVDAEPKPAAHDVSVAVVGSQCAIAGAESIDCTLACRRLEAESDPGRRIEIDATQGSHGTVEALRSCLADAGLTAVDVRSE
jgi:hypothetical protein